MPLTHRPRGLGHPYARSADQRWPLVPEDGERVALGVTAPGADEVTVEWDSGDGILTFPMSPGVGEGHDAAALAGGSGHLAGAQAAALDAPGAWSWVSPPVTRDARYRFVAGGEETEWFEVPVGRWEEGHGHLTLTGPAARRLVPGSEAWFVSADGVHRVRCALRLEAGEHLLGFGERFDRLDQRGNAFDSVVFEQYKRQGEHGRTYLPMPFAHVIGDVGWGFHVATSRRVWFDAGRRDPDLLWIEAEIGATRSLERDPAEAALTIHGFAGTPAEVLDQFLAQVGRPAEMPDWVFRLWASGNEWNTQALVMEQMDAHRDHRVPVGVVVIEAWSDEEGIMLWRDARYAPHPDGAPFSAADLEFPADGAWPDPAAMIEELHRRGIRVILWQIPLIKTTDDERELGEQVHADGAALVAAGHAIRQEDGSPYLNRGWWFPQALMPDLSTPEGRAWWGERRRYLVRDFGVDGFKTDGGEHAWGAELRYAPGPDGRDRRGDEANNLNPVHYARALGELLISEGKAPVTFSRAGYSGSQAWGLHWAGDEDSTWEAFRNSLTAGLTAGSSGILYWGWDLAGFSGPVPDPELYLRAAWASAYLPVMQYHSEFHHHQPPKRDRTPWWIAESHGAPWVIDEFREVVRAREDLVPYLAEQARRSIAGARPLMRALPFEFPEDGETWNWRYQFLCGDDLLVCPVVEAGATTLEVYLPDPGEGRQWRAEGSGDVVAPGRHTIALEGWRIPVFRRA